MRFKFLFVLSFLFLSVGSFAQETESCVIVPETVGPHAVAPMDFQLMVQFECEFSTYELKVYDVAGSLVFETTDQKARWNAKDATPGDYFCKIKGIVAGGTKFQETYKFKVLD